MATPLPLEGDGLIDNLFHFLWSKDDFGAGPRIYVPHTVVYKASQPSSWYFTSLKSGKIKKKNKINLTNLTIEHEFTKHTKQNRGSSSDIVACYLYQVSGDFNGSSGSAYDHNDDATEPASSTIIEYFDAATLHDFLFTREKPHNGILQRFILPKGTHNATIRAIWSPKICLLERRVNLKSLYDAKYSVYERGVTFDGGGAGEMFSKPEPVRGAMLPGEVQLLCEQIVDHVTQVSYHKYRISRMVLHLKSDAEDRLWLLWCSSLRLLRVSSDASSATIRPLDIVSDAQVPAHVSLGRVSHPSLSTPSPHEKHHKSHKSRHSHPEDDPDVPLRDGFQRCTSCARVVEQFRMLTTNYKAVLEHFQRFLLFLRLKVNEQEQVAIEWPPEQRLIDAAGGVGFGILPFCEKPSSHAGKQAGSPHSKRQATSHIAGLNAQELIIPPVIQYLHPSLGVDDFERHRSDPIFLHKPVAVCESCCLVYSDYTTTALEINSLRPNVPAILRPQREVNDLKRRLDPIDPITMAVTSPGRTKDVVAGGAKPPASAWKPIPKNVEKAARLSGASGLTKSTLHSLPPAPTLPERIESLAEFIGSLPSSGSNLTLGSSASAGALLPSREETFFRELYHQQGVDVGEGHPLQHMLESSGKLAHLSSSKKKQLTAIRKGVVQFTESSGASSPVDWRGLGKSASMNALDQALTKKTSKNPYTIVQKLTAPDQARRKLKQRRALLHKGTPSWEDEELRENDDDHASGSDGRSSPSPLKSKGRSSNHSNNNSKSSPRKFVSVREAQASEAHQEFLFAALSDAQQQLERLESLSSIVSCSSTCSPSSLNAAVSPQFPVEAATVDELQSMLSENASLRGEEGQTDDGSHFEEY